MAIDSSPIVRRKLSDEVTERLKRLISSGQLQPQANPFRPSESSWNAFKLDAPRCASRCKRSTISV